MKIKDITAYLESIAAPALQEDYDNAGLLTGDPDWECKGIICSLDCTEDIIAEAIEKKCNLVVAHHPIIFRGLKKINGKNYVERTVIKAIQHNIAIYAIHTNLDNVKHGVNGKIASILGLGDTEILSPKENTLCKLYTFVPLAQADQVRNAIFSAGGGHIGNYSECSFNAEGFGTFKAGENTHPFVGEKNSLHREPELKIEVVFPAWLQNRMVSAMKEPHPYEEPAFDMVSLQNPLEQTGSGLVGNMSAEMSEKEFLECLKSRFKTTLVKHSKLLNRKIRRVAVCGGAGSFLIHSAIAAGADAYVTADLKYHEYFEADGRLLLADIGHYESEQFTIELLHDILLRKLPTFAVLKTTQVTNPVNYS
jgi:dinuclear metal center YbgI/SA1388 family protein